MTWRTPHQSPWSEPYEVRLGRAGSRTVRNLIIINIVVFVVQLSVDVFTGGAFTRLFGLSRSGMMTGRVWQLVTYMFLHDTGLVLHLLFNMLVLHFLGPETERGMGRRHFLTLYFLSGILGGVGWVLIDRWGICIGASGAVFGMLGAFATLYPRERLALLFLPMISMPAWIFVGGIALIEVAFLAGGSGGNVAHIVHVGGVAVGAVYAWVIFRMRGRQGWGRAPRLRIVKPRHQKVDATVEIDRILDKIATKGLSSLSRKEREALNEASRG